MIKVNGLFFINQFRYCGKLFPNSVDFSFRKKVILRHGLMGDIFFLFAYFKWPLQV